VKLTLMSLLLIILVSCSTNVTMKKEVSEEKSDIQESISILIKALNDNNFYIIEPLLSEDYNVPGVPASMSKMVFEQVVSSYKENIHNYEIIESNPEGSDIRIIAKFIYSDKQKEFDFLLNPQAEFIEINIFHTLKKEVEDIKKENIEIPVFMQIPFTLSSKLITVEAEVNGKKGNFLVDSGAPHLVLNNKHFKTEEVNSVSGMGVSGVISGTDIKKIKNFIWQEFKITDFDAITMDLSHLEEQLETEFLGLIGQAELSHFEVHYDYTNMNMMCFKLDDSGNRIPQVMISDPNHTIEFEMGAHIPILSMKILNKTYKMGLDTGAETNLFSETLLSELSESTVFTDIDTLYGADKQKQAVRSGELISCKIGEETFEKMKTVFSDISHLNSGYDLKIDGLIGYEFLSRQRTAINYKKKELYLW
jgi:Aspartyl protease